MIKSEIVERIGRVVDSKEEEIIAFLRNLVRFNTVNPPGNEKPLQEWLAKEMISRGGYSVELLDVLPGRPDLVSVLRGKGSAGGGGHSMLLNGHIDTAEVPDASSWKHDPWGGIVENGFLYGRGASDMKGGVVAMIMALECLRASGFTLLGDVTVHSVMGEEKGEPGTAALIEKGYMAEFGIDTEPTDLSINPVSGGLIWFWVSIKGNPAHNASRWDSIYPGGRSEGVNAIEKAVKVIQGLQELERHWGRTRSHPLLPLGMTTINPGEIRGGPSPAFMAAFCDVHYATKFYPNENPDSIMAEIKQHVEFVSMADAWLRRNPPEVQSPDLLWPPVDVSNHPGLRTLEEAHEAVLGRKADLRGFAAAADNAWLTKAGTPTVLFGPGQLREAHVRDEKISVSDLLTGTKILALSILEWCGYEG